MLATIPVTLASDAASPTGSDSGITLREAIGYVNGDTVPTEDQGLFDFANLGTNDKIIFALPSGEDTITLNKDASGGTINPDNGGLGDLDITESVTIDAEEQDITIDASGNDPTPNLDNGDGSRVFFMEVDGVSTGVTLRGLSLTGGDAGLGGGAREGGGAIAFVNFEGDPPGKLIVEDSIFWGNHALGHGGAMDIHAGNVEIRQSSIFNNSTQDEGGGIHGGYIGSSFNITVEQSTIYNNSSGYVGGGISLIGGGTATITQTTISGNSASAADKVKQIRCQEPFIPAGRLIA